MKKILFLDTTLRDGEQTPGVHLNRLHKVEIARQLDRLGVDIIEAGFPAASKSDLRAVQEITQIVRRPVIAALARALSEDIFHAAEALKEAEKSRIHVFIASSDIHIKYKYHSTREEILKRAVEAVSYARSFCNDVQFSPEDASRTDPEFLYLLIEAVVEAGANVVNIPDTVGYAVQEEFGALIKNIVLNMPNIAVSAHCHNDLGNATSNSLAAILNGAKQIECTVNGVGERAGNASLEEIVVNLHARAEYFGCETNIDTTEISRTSRLVSSLIGINIPPNKAIVGANVFAHESGIHQHGILNDRSTYEIFTPVSIGLTAGRLPLGKLSGRHAFSEKLKELGYELNSDAVDICFKRFKDYAGRKNITDEDVMAIVNEYMDTLEIVFELKSFQIQSGNDIKAMAMVTMNCKGLSLSEAAIGDGPIDAAFNAINRISGAEEIKLEEYSIKAVTEGTDALGEAKVKIKIGNASYTGRSVSTDIIEASIRSYINALNKWGAI